MIDCTLEEPLDLAVKESLADYEERHNLAKWPKLVCRML